MDHSFCLDLPRAVIGVGAARAVPGELAALGARRPLLVTDPGIVRAGIVRKLETVLAQFGPLAVFDSVTENPLFSDVTRGVHLYREGDCDSVIALGGGSVIDTAKFIALIATNGGEVAEYVQGPTDHGRCATLLVIPTTAGTGSEASPDAGIHPDGSSPSVGMRSRYIVPHVAVLDPELTASLPPRLTAATGIDAISHCVEGFLSINESRLTDAMLLDAIERAIASLHILVAEPANLAVRAELQTAAFVGGLGIGMGLGPAHAIAIACGDQGHQHGILSGIGLVCTLDPLEPFEPARIARLREVLHAAPEASLSASVAKLMRDVGLPASLSELGYRLDDATAAADTAFRAPFNMTARHHFSQDAFRTMIERSWHGRA